MERIEDLLREEFRRTDGVFPTPRDAMLARVAKVRRRRTATVAGLAVVVVGAAAVAAAGLPGPSGRDVGGGAPQALYSAELINVVFTDHDHGFVVEQYCGMLVPDSMPSDGSTPDIHEQCRTSLLVTADAGRSWQERALPGDPATKDAGVELVRGHSLMLWMDGPGRLALGGWDRRYWTTTDAGTTWHESTTPRPVGLAGFGPDDRLAFLSTYPPGGAPGEKNPLVAATDGSFWLACATGPCVQVTRDQGQTWHSRPVGVTAGSVDWVATADGQTVYAAVRDNAGPHLVRSLDGGATWAEVPGVSGLPEHGADGLALPNGDLIMTAATQDGGVFRIRANATTAEKLVGAPAHPSVVYRTAGWVVAASVWDQREESDVGSVASISPDNGTTWLAVPAPTA